MPKQLLRHHDPGSLFVIALTLILFVAALFVKGFSHDLLLEAGVFLVSVKLILMAHKNSEIAQRVDGHLLQIQQQLQELQQSRANHQTTSSTANSRG